MNNDEKILEIYKQIKNNSKNYYIPVIKNKENICFDDIYNGESRLFFLKNNLYVIPEELVPTYQFILPKKIEFLKLTEIDFNLILDICIHFMCSKEIVFTYSEKNLFTENPLVIDILLDDELKDRERKDIVLNYIDRENITIEPIRLKEELNFIEKLIFLILILFLLFVKVIFLYTSYILIFKIIGLHGIFAGFLTFILWIILNSLSDFVVHTILD